jgi:hypothetical protein
MMRIRWLLGTALLAAAASTQAAEVIGRVLVAVGEVSAVRAGREVQLRTASPIEAGDSVRTGPASNAQIRLTDESIVALRPETEFAFTEYRYGGREDRAERAFFRLLKGGLRTITGIVGRRNHENYRLETPTATIGIRGTHYVLVMCEQNCLNADGSRAPDGLYGNATGFSFGTNQVSAVNKTGERVFGVNQPFHVPDINSEPRRLIAPPEFLADKLAGRNRNLGKGGSAEGAQEAAAANTDGRSASSPPSPEALPTTAPEQRNSAGQLAAVTNGAASASPPVTPPAVIPGAGNGATIYFDTPSTSFAQPLIDASFSVDAQGQLAVFSDGSITAARGPGGATDVGANAAAGNLHWGMWPDPIVNSSTLAFLHFVVGDVASLPGTGVFTYSPVGGTRPTNAVGVTGMFVGGAVTVDFTPGTLQLNNWQIAFGGSTYIQSGGGSSTFGRSPSFNGGVTYSCSGPNCGGATASGNFAGSFTGAGAQGMGIVYGILDGGANGQIVGAQGFKR